MLQEYIPVLIFLGVAAALGGVLLGLGFLIGRGRKDEEKLSPYECGFEAFDDSRMKFDVRYYLVAILFIIFDLEIAFLFPWAVSLDAVGRFGIAAMGIFLAILVPSRMDLGEYQDYLQEVMAAVGQINATYATGAWEPVRVLVGESYERAVAAMQCYDVLLVNSIADGMNLIAKEGPVVNRRYGQLVLSERTGAREQLESAAIVISPCDISATADALHMALTMPESKRRENAQELRALVEKEDVFWWLCQQIETVEQLGL